MKFKQFTQKSLYLYLTKVVYCITLVLFFTETSFTINLPKDRIVKMAVYILFGQQIDLVDFSYQMKGKQELTYQPKYLPTETYIAKLYLDDAILGNGKLVKME